MIAATAIWLPSGEKSAQLSAMPRSASYTTSPLTRSTIATFVLSSSVTITPLSIWAREQLADPAAELDPTTDRREIVGIDLMDHAGPFSDH